MLRDIGRPQYKTFIRKLPKAELHVHLEGTLEPEMLFRLANHNRIDLKWKSPEELRNAYRFQNLSGFLEAYFKGCEVMKAAEDFHDATRADLCELARNSFVEAVSGT